MMQSAKALNFYLSLQYAKHSLIFRLFSDFLPRSLHISAIGLRASTEIGDSADWEQEHDFLEATKESFAEVETSKGKRYYESEDLTFDNCEKECENDCKDYCEDEAKKDCKDISEDKKIQEMCEKKEFDACIKKEKCSKKECEKLCDCIAANCAGTYERATKEFDKCGESCDKKKKEYSFLSAVM